MKEQSNYSITERDKQVYLPVFKRFPIAVSRASGAYVWDADGKRYLDVLAGIAVNNLGHCHPEVVAAVREQAGILMHCSNFFVNIPQLELSEMLVRLSGLSRVFMTNSGTESVEGAIKAARKYAHKQGRGGTVISFHNAFHGRTMAAIAAGNEKYQKGFAPIPEGFKQVPFNDLKAVEQAVGKDTAAILVEPVQGEGGIRVADPDFLNGIRALCDRENLVLIFDEVQCGIGRTGHWFAKQHFDVEPDVMALAKGLGSGLPIGAFLVNDRISDAIDFGDHGTTFGGNPIACAAALATLKLMEREKIPEAAKRKGTQFMKALRDIDHQAITEVRGLGLMIGMELDSEARPVVMELLEQGVIANATAGNVMRFVPPLTISEEQLSVLLEKLEAALNKIFQYA